MRVVECTCSSRRCTLPGSAPGAWRTAPGTRGRGARPPVGPAPRQTACRTAPPLEYSINTKHLGKVEAQLDTVCGLSVPKAIGQFAICAHAGRLGRRRTQRTPSVSASESLQDPGRPQASDEADRAWLPREVALCQRFSKSFCSTRVKCAKCKSAQKACGMSRMRSGGCRLGGALDCGRGRSNLAPRQLPALPVLHMHWAGPSEASKIQHFCFPGVLRYYTNFRHYELAKRRDVICRQQLSNS